MFVESWLVGALVLVGAFVVCATVGTAVRGYGPGTVAGAGIGVIVGVAGYLAVTTVMVRGALPPERRRGAYVSHVLVAFAVVATIWSIVEGA